MHFFRYFFTPDMHFRCGRHQAPPLTDLSLGELDWEIVTAAEAEAASRPGRLADPTAAAADAVDDARGAARLAAALGDAAPGLSAAADDLDVGDSEGDAEGDAEGDTDLKNRSVSLEMESQSVEESLEGSVDDGDLHGDGQGDDHGDDHEDDPSLTQPFPEPLPDDIIKVAVVGRPNVGKSSFLNQESPFFVLLSPNSR